MFWVLTNCANKIFLSNDYLELTLYVRKKKKKKKTEQNNNNSVNHWTDFSKIFRKSLDEHMQIINILN